MKAIVMDKFMQNTWQWLKTGSVKGIEEKCEATPIMERRHTVDSETEDTDRWIQGRNMCCLFTKPRLSYPFPDPRAEPLTRVPYLDF